ESAYFEASRPPAHQIDDFRPPREQRTSRAEVAFLHGLVQPRRCDAIDSRFQLRPALEPVRARQHELRVVQGEGLRRAVRWWAPTSMTASGDWARYASNSSLACRFS